MSDKLNILIFTRTSNRPLFFEDCYQSIKVIKDNKCYKNISVYHIVSFDNLNTLDYISKYDDIIKVEVKPQTRQSFEYFPYNLYFNQMYDYLIGYEQVNKTGLITKNTWIMYLDDDDVYLNVFVLQDLYQYLVKYKFNPNILLLWRVQFPTNIIPTHDTFEKDVVQGEISTIGVCHHISHLEHIKWDDMKQGDYRFIRKLYELPNMKTEWINKVYTGINYKMGSGGLGCQQDKNKSPLKRRKVLNKFKKNNSKSVKKIKKQKIQSTK
jgi:hypothetical protein